jgi:serine/threonine-protein kinase
LNISSGPSSATAAVQEGDVIAGKYRVDKILGRGGMGVVVEARHIQLDEKVALKFLLPEALTNIEALGRFAREARAAVKIKSEHVARVIDVGELENGLPYMVMEYLDGSDLSSWLSERGSMQVEEVVAIVLQACEALAEAHALGIVHRDLKPSNLFLAKRPSGPPIVKVLDFGISKTVFSSTNQPPITTTSGIVGSPLYMSPEQMQSSRTIDGRSDIWALGVVLYELLARKAPFPGKSLPELITAVLHLEHESLRAARPDVSPAFEEVVNRCLAKDPAARFANVGEMAAALAPFGPPRSDVSVERIRHVLGFARAQPAPKHSLSPFATSVIPADFGVPPVANTAPDGPGSGAGTTPVTVGQNEALAASVTTSKRVSTDPGRKPRSNAKWALAAVGSFVVLGVGGVAARKATSTRETATAASSLPEPTAPPAPTVSEPPSATGVSPPDTPAVSPPALALGAPIPAAASAGTNSGSDAGHVRGVLAKPPSPPQKAKLAPSPLAPKPNCNPPYVFDFANHRQYKPECY